MTVKATNNGVEIKALKGFEGMEGWTYQGNLYVENKKVAAWSQDSHGGIVDWLTMEPGFSEDKLRSIFADVDSNLGLELAMNELVVLKDRLKAYKKAKKDGYGGIFVLCGGFWEEIFRLETRKPLNSLRKNFFHSVRRILSATAIRRHIFIRKMKISASGNRLRWMIFVVNCQKERSRNSGFFFLNPKISSEELYDH